MASSTNGNHVDANDACPDTRRKDNYEYFLSVIPQDTERTKHRRTASMRSDIGSRRRHIAKPPVRTGSASRLELLDCKNGDKSPCLHEPTRLQRVRSFTKTSKGLVNRGDSIRRRHDVKPQNSDRHSERSVDSARDTAGLCNHVAPSYFRVAVLGASKVGKSSLVCQFMTSEYMGAMDTNQAEGEQSVSVVVDGTESNVDFIDEHSNQNIPQDILADGYVVVYSLTDKRSFRSACDLISSLRQADGAGQAIVLVGNKNDLVRKRKVTEHEGKRAAHAQNCVYMETSAAICHNVDELLVKMVGEVRKYVAGDKPRDHRAHIIGCKTGSKQHISQTATGFLRRIYNSIRRPKKRTSDL